MKVSRRSFVTRSAITMVGLGFSSPLVRAVPARTRAAGSSSKRVLVVVNLDGGNDGLNTVVPLPQYDRYRSMRRTLAVDRDRLLRLSNAPDVALNPFMTSLADLYDDGRVAVVNGFGPPLDAPGLLDHFRGQLRIQTGDAVAPERSPTGWIGRALDLSGEGLVAPAVEFGGGRRMLTGDLALRASGVRRELLSVRSVENVGIVLPEDSDALHRAYDNIQRIEVPGGGVADRARRLRKQFVDQAAIIKERTAGYVPAVTYPGAIDAPLGFALGQCARLISADIGVRAIAVGSSGFDTHAAQNDGGTASEPGGHDFLLQSVSDGLGLFYADLAAHGLANDVLTLVMSEFGRRPRENAQRGTDHGIASVAFVVGGSVRGGVYGEYPSLDDDRLVQGENLATTTDFRSVFATILARFFDQDPGPVLDYDGPLLGFL